MFYVDLVMSEHIQIFKVHTQNLARFGKDKSYFLS